MDRHPASYRDPSGFIFEKDNLHYRTIKPSYFAVYDDILKKGIYGLLWQKGWLINHEEISRNSEEIILKPDQIDFINYPYEWSFTAYKHAAQLTLRIQMLLLEKGFSLKDASAFNITFHNGKACFIDTLSIEPYAAGQPWKALQQFNEHFLAPLLLSKYYGSSHLKSLLNNINGISLKQAASILPWSSKLSPTIYSHIHYLSKKENETVGKSSKESLKAISKSSQLKILKALDHFISNLKLKENTQWSSYYNQTNYELDAFNTKKEIVRKWIENIAPKKIIDLGGNDGTFLREIKDLVNHGIVCDIDQSAIDSSYKSSLKLKGNKVISIVGNILEPAPGIGFNNKERTSLIERLNNYKSDVNLALAIIHHITITGNVPFEMSAEFFASLSPKLIIEFPSREDSWVKFLLDSKRDARSLFDHYNKTTFESIYSNFFEIKVKKEIENSHRTLYLLERIER